jgi:putative transposase
MFKKHLNKYQLMKYIAKLRKKNKYWQLVGSQAMQDICDRIQKAYDLFFKFHKRGVKPPSFCKSKKYKSFTLKQAGYKFLGSNKIKINKTIYKFHLSREIKGKVKTVTIKRNAIGQVYLIVVTDFIDKSFGVVTGTSRFEWEASHSKRALAL